MSRVLVVSFSVFPAPDRHGVQLAHVLRALGSRCEVDALTLKVEELAYVERMGGVRMMRVPVGAGGLAEQVTLFRRAVLRQLEGAEYDAIHVRGAWEGRPVLERKRELGARVVLELARSIEGGPRPGDTALAEQWARDEAFCLGEADLVIVPTARARATLESRGVAAPVEVVAPGVDVDLYDVESGRENVVPAPPGLEDAPVVLCAGTIGPGHGVRLLLAAMERVVARTAARLVLLGPIEPGFEDELARAIARSCLGPACQLLAAVAHEDLPRVLDAAAVCVAPATPEADVRPLATFPTKILEYLACRRAVVAPSSPGVRELLRDGEEALLFHPGDPGRLASAILDLLADRALRARVAEAGYRAVRLGYPASATRRRLLHAYAALLPPARWRPVQPGARPLGGAPVDPDTTTAQRLLSALDQHHREAAAAQKDARREATAAPASPQPWYVEHASRAPPPDGAAGASDDLVDADFTAAGPLLGSPEPAERTDPTVRLPAPDKPR